MINYSIFQLRHGNNKMFMSKRMLDKMNMEINLDEYSNVYTGTLGVDNSVNINVVLETIYNILNIAHPEDFKGHSLSTSDIVCIDNKYYFCDSFGFVEINK